MSVRKLTPKTFSTDAPLLHSMLADRGYAARMVYVTVDKAPVWHDGDVVAEVTGEYPAGYPWREDSPCVVLLDNGSLSILASWRIDKERS